MTRPGSHACGPDKPGASILIIEDDEGAVETFGQILSNNGYGVRVAFDAESGLAEVDRAAPAAILVDLHLPTIDGVEFLRRLRARAAHARLPIAMVTGDYFIDEGLAQE